ncbi:MAG: ATP-binding protein [Desulfovermiculus sp.]
MTDYQEIENEKVLSMRFSARLENIERVCQSAERFLKRQDIVQECFAILLALREMVNNAVIHGSQLNPELHVRVSMALRQDVLCMDIQDQGVGFDWQSRLEASCLDSDACSGRGLGLVQCYTDSCTFQGAGNEVQLTKKVCLSGPNTKTMPES